MATLLAFKRGVDEAITGSRRNQVISVHGLLPRSLHGTYVELVRRGARPGTTGDLQRLST